MKKSYFNYLLTSALMLIAYVSFAQPTAPPSSPTNEAVDVISVYSDTYTSIYTNIDPFWGQATDATEVDFSGNKVLKYANLNYQGLEYTSTNVAAMEYIHIDYYTEDATTFEFYLIAGGENAFNVHTDANYGTGSWKSIDIEISSAYAARDLTAAFQFKTVGNGTIYLDNLYFWKTPAPAGSDVSLSDLSVDATTITGFAPATTSYNYIVPAETQTVPTVTVTTNDSEASAVVTPATSIPGSTTILVTSANQNVTETYTVNFIVTTPGVAAPTPPTRNPSDVIALSSEAYTEVTVDTWRTDWSSGAYEEVTIAGNIAKLYTNLDFVGIETTTNKLDITNMTHVHFDVWSHNATRIGLKLVDFGPDGNKEHQINTENIAKGEWVGIDIPISSFTGMTTKANVAQYIFAALPTGSTRIFIDNFYFYVSSDLTISENTTSTGNIVCNNLTVNSGSTFTISAGHSLTVNGDLTNNGSLIVKSGATLITFDSNTSGNVTIERNTRYDDGRYSFVGSPVASSPSITGSTLGSISYYYDEPEAYGEDGLARWKDASNVQLAVGKGYAQANQKMISFTGVPNDGDVVVSGLTHSAGVGEVQGWNLISNPYPAAIKPLDLFQLPSNNVMTGSIYLWDDHGSDQGRGNNDDYLVANQIGATGPNGGSWNGFIGAMQGFIVKIGSPIADASITFKESMRVSNNNADNNFFRTETSNPLNIRLELTSNKDGYRNDLLIGYRDDATLGKDRLYDADKFISNDRLQFYSLISGEKFAIQGLPLEAGISTELGFNLGMDDRLTLKINEVSGLAEGMTFFLHDSQTGKIYDLSNVASIDFDAKAGKDQNRFKLTYAVAGVLGSELVQDQPIYRFVNDQLRVDFNEVVKVQGFVVYDLSGKVTSERELNGASLHNVSIPINNTGVTIVKIVTDRATYTRKFIF